MDREAWRAQFMGSHKQGPLVTKTFRRSASDAGPFTLGQAV